MVEQLPVKQPAEGSSPSFPATFAVLAQMEERRLCNSDVAGSIPAHSSKLAALAQRQRQSA